LVRAHKKGCFVHPMGICESLNVGKGARIWAFSHVLPGAIIGRDSNICDHVFVENDVVIGARVTIKSHVALWDGIMVEDDVFIGPGAQFPNDKNPRSKRYLKSYSKTVIGKGASIGSLAVVMPGVNIGQYSMIGAGAVVTKDVPPFSLMTGVPARHDGFVCRCGHRLERDGNLLRCPLGGWHGKNPSARMRCANVR